MKKRKTAAKPLPKPVRWYAPDQKIFDHLVGLGTPKGAIYQGWKGQTPEKINMRHGEVLGVVDGFRAFGGKRAINAAVKHIHSKGATILDLDTGRNSRDHALELRDDAVGVRRKLPESVKLAQADARRKASGQMLKADAWEVWKGPGSVAQKAEATGWPQSALYAAFGKTHGPTGRPPKKVK